LLADNPPTGDPALEELLPLLVGRPWDVAGGVKRCACGGACWRVSYPNPGW